MNTRVLNFLSPKSSLNGFLQLAKWRKKKEVGGKFFRKMILYASTYPAITNVQQYDNKLLANTIDR